MMNPSVTVRLLDIEPELGRYLTPPDAAVLDGLPVPVLELGVGDVDLDSIMAANHAFGMVVLDGMLMRRHRFQALSCRRSGRPSRSGS
jgi:hypothetical protein